MMKLRQRQKAVTKWSWKINLKEVANDPWIQLKSAIIEAASEEDDDDDDLTVRNPFPEAFLENSKDNDELKNVIG